MNSHGNRRDTRVVTGPEFTIAFTLQGHAFQDIRIMNLSVGGCFALLGGRTARFFLPGATLDGLVLLHPDLPKGPIRAAVAYVLGYSTSGEATDQVGMGLQFLSLDAATRAALEAWLAIATAGQAGEG
ncbi:PilZ domain-containing protein [Geothrix fuzhouensis]|uniref:PilZ domain-containing protein n=1 Tax=Geothrix fuzhouensis TaxID=2966451 RepID=UPI00214856B8|nr:PilZ domain-containing protein [Geothrix fuzhouensis]